EAHSASELLRVRGGDGVAGEPPDLTTVERDLEPGRPPARQRSQQRIGVDRASPQESRFVGDAVDHRVEAAAGDARGATPPPPPPPPGGGGRAGRRTRAPPRRRRVSTDPPGPGTDHCPPRPAVPPRPRPSASTRPPPR